MPPKAARKKPAVKQPPAKKPPAKKLSSGNQTAEPPTAPERSCSSVPIQSTKRAKIGHEIDKGKEFDTEAGIFNSPEEDSRTEQDDTPTKEQSQKNQKRQKLATLKKGISSRKSSKGATLEAPGDPLKPSTFISIESNEQKLGAYVGYNDVRQLRILTVTWPLIKAYLQFEPIALNMNKKTAFRLIEDDETLFQNGPDFAKLWPLQVGDTEDDKRNKKARHLACILMTLEGNLGIKLKGNPPATNSQLQKKYAALFTKEAPTAVLPKVLFTKSGQEVSAGPAALEVVPPVLGPYQQETRMESINRCWNLLRYFRYCRTAGKLWDMRFSESGMSQKIMIDSSHVPRWLLPPANVPERPAALTKTSAVIAADNLPTKDISIVWESVASGDDKEDLDEALKVAKSKGIPVPSAHQKLRQDPRLSPSAAAFRDAVRRQFNCQKLGMNIRALDLEYTNPTLSQGKLTRDVLRDDWSESRSTFENDANANFILRVVFQALDDPDEGIYESFEPPSAISDFFHTSTGDVMADDTGISKMAAAAFSSHQNQPEATVSGESSNKAEPFAGPHYVDLMFGHGGGSNEIGEAPDPKKDFKGADGHQKLLKWYDGYDVTTENGRLEWQQSVLTQITTNARSATVTIDKLPKTFTNAEKAAVNEAEALGQLIAMAKEVEEDDEEAVSSKTAAKATQGDEDYYTMQTAFSGTSARSGPYYDLCLRVLDCETLPNGMIRSRLLKGLTTRTFFNYQISGAVGVIIRLYGKIDVDKLLAGVNQKDNPRASDMKEAASRLTHPLIHGAILADEVGLGKTQQSLLVAILHRFLNDTQRADDDSKVLYKPILLVVPPTLINQWLQELRSCWPGLRVIISYEGHDFKDVMALASISHTAMKEYPAAEAIPRNLRYIFDTSDPKAAEAILLTSYNTHKLRTGTKKIKKVPGVAHKPPRYGLDGRMIWKKKPRKQPYWTTNHVNVYSLMIADEAQKIKNYSTGIWSILYLHSVRKTLLVTATPMYNSARDLIALLAMLWPMAQTEVEALCKVDPEASEWLFNVRNDGLDLVDELRKLPDDDARKLSILDPKPVRTLLNRRTDTHIGVSKYINSVQDLALVQRSLASVLPVSEGDPIELRGMFQKIIRKTAVIERNPDEEVEYQFFHREAAQMFNNEIMNNRASGPMNSKIVDKGGFISAAQPLRKLNIANFSTKLARLDALMEKAGGNTLVATLNAWRDRGFEADFVQDLTRGAGEHKATSARELLVFLCEGSPAARLLFQEILTTKVLQKVNKAQFGHHQKLIVAESTTANAFYLQVLLRCALIDGRVMHAGFSNRAKSELIEMFNNPNSSLKVMIMMYDVGGAGLNLHLACNSVLLLSIARSKAQETQIAGRALRVTSEFPVKVTRRYTPNSHDLFRETRQTDKATVQLAANAQDPALRALMVRLLSEMQVLVNAAHKNPDNKALLAEKAESQRIKEASWAARKQEFRRKLRESTAEKDIAKEKRQLETVPEQSSAQSGKRKRKSVSRYNDLDYDAAGNFLQDAAERQARRYEAGELPSCEVCRSTIKYSDDYAICRECCVLAHFACHGIPKQTTEDFPIECNNCLVMRCIHGAGKDESIFQKGRTRSRGASVASESEDEVSQADQYEGVDYDGETDGDESYESDDADNSPESSDDESSENDDADNSPEGSDFEDNLIVSLRDRSDREKTREDILIAREEEAFFRSLGLSEFIAEDQPDDETRQRKSLLSLEPGIVWTEKDLDLEAGLRLGLHLLYNKIQGKKDLQFGYSIHIHYMAFPKDVVALMEKNRKANDAQVRGAKKRAL